MCTPLRRNSCTLKAADVSSCMRMEEWICTNLSTQRCSFSLILHIFGGDHFFFCRKVVSALIFVVHHFNVCWYTALQKNQITKMSEAAPLWICFVPQLASVVGDSFGQRSSRVFHAGNRRRFIIGLIAVSSVQMFVVLSIIQLALPKTTTIIYVQVNHTTVDFCALPENVGDDRCFAQGPLTIYRAVELCPFLLFNGILNLVYYVGEASMYRQSLGVLMLVLAALASSFVIAPMQNWFDLEGAKQVNGGAIALGILGALCCLIERMPPGASAAASPVAASTFESDVESDRASLKEHPVANEHSRLNSDLFPTTPTMIIAPFDSSGNRVIVTLRKIRTFLPLLAPFLLLSFAYALYFVLMQLYNDKCKINMWGYNAFDQVSFPVYMFAVFIMVDFIAPCREKLRWDEKQDDTLMHSIKATYREMTANRCAGFINMFVYRLLINARAIAYTYITVQYNLSSSYLQLTLIRVVLSWVASLMLVLLVPKFILSEPLEQLKLRDWVNLSLKCIGTIAIVGSLLIIHYS